MNRNSKDDANLCKSLYKLTFDTNCYSITHCYKKVGSWGRTEVTKNNYTMGKYLYDWL